MNKRPWDKARRDTVERTIRRIRDFGGPADALDARALIDEIDRLQLEVEQLTLESRCAVSSYAEPIIRSQQDTIRALQGENRRLQGEVKEMERRLDLTRAARNVAVDKLIQIARVIRPDDYEDTEEEG